MSYTIDESLELLPFLLKIMKDRSRNSIKSILKRGQVMIDGHVITQHNHVLNPGQHVDILTNKAARKFAHLKGITILHEDDSIIVINKEPGVLSMASNNPNELNAYYQLTEYVKFDHSRNRVFIVHRLDRETSGVMVFAKTEQIKEKLQRDWHSIVRKRIYLALVEGNVKKESDTISSWLKETNTLHVYSSLSDNGGKHAVTHYKKINHNSKYSLLEVELETGRKNQIRVHMQDIGHSIVGDKKYGAKHNPIKRLGLHAKTLEFKHPTTEKIVNYTIKAPDNFKEMF